MNGGKSFVSHVAIMFTDIKDFTKRMNASESLGMRLLRTHNEIMDGAIERHHGVLVKNIGDAYLVDFGSAVNAVEAAVDAQALFARFNKEAGPDEEILVRISIHLGDVVVQGADVFGDGVNVASRLQSITPPGGICISREVYTHVKSKMNAECVSIGSHALKGVTDSVDVYQVLTPLVPHPIAAPGAGRSPAGDEKKAPAASIAVLPFANWSEDKESEYFSDGITEDIITDLAKIDSLRVSSRNSVFTYKGKNVKMKKVGAELNVRWVLEGRFYYRDAIQRSRGDTQGARAAYERALVCAVLHDKEGVLTWLRKLRDEGTIIYRGLRNDIGFEEYADDPDFQAVAGGPAAPERIPESESAQRPRI
jgi:adenylate cyclase